MASSTAGADRPNFRIIRRACIATEDTRRRHPTDQPAYCLPGADHDDREGTRNRATAAAACRWRGPRRWSRRWRRGLRSHRKQMARLAVKRDCARAVRRPGLQVLLDLETRRVLLLDDGHRAVALRAARFH